MFQTILANAAYSPSTVTYIRFYVGRLQKEEFTRRLGLVFSAIVVALQSFAIISPPEPTIAAGPNNIIYSGVTSVDDLLKKYDANNDGNGHQDVQQIFTHYGISREDIASAKITTIRSTDRDRKLRSIGRKPYGKAGETRVQIEGTNTTVYERFLWSWDSGSYSTYRVIQGVTADGRWFAVLMNCGNLVIDEPPPAPENPVGEVQHTCDAITGWAYDPNAPERAIKVLVYIRLDGSSDPVYKTTVSANLSTPRSPVEGNHGFKVQIPKERKSETRKTIYSVVALDLAGGGQDADLARTVYIEDPCIEPQPQPEPAPEMTVCDTQTGTIVTISEDEYNSSRHKNPNQCDELEICIDNEIVTIKRFEYTGQQETCPSIQVCRDGVVVTITSDKRQPGDLEPDQCDEIEVCRDGELVVITKAERRSTDTDPHPELLCDDPFPVFVYSKHVRNQTQDIADADGTIAQPGDVLVYTLSAENVGYAAGSVEFQEDLTDVMEYATLVEFESEAEVKEDQGFVIDWGTVEISPDETISRTVTVQVVDRIPVSPSPTNNLESNNLELRNVWFDETVVVSVPRPVTKTPEVLAAALPKTGPGASTTTSLILIMTAAYFYTRNRQLKTELLLVQKGLA